MSNQIPWLFFCSEADYPKFLALLPNDLPPAYHEFVSVVDKCIANEMKQLTIVKTYVGFDEFTAFCKARGKVPDYDTLIACTFQAWGRNGQS